LLADFVGRMAKYADTRNFPAIKGPSYLSVSLRFGTVSIRQLVNEALLLAHTEGGATWLSELIWRDFYHQIMHHHPHAMRQALKPEYDNIAWETDSIAERNFSAWCEGRTGYPLVDAAQRQLNQTGYMHNRLRMVSACFLIKDLGIDWRRGEAYFAQHLNDFDLAANNGGWQWAASSGCDAQPYFRIFNPITQSEKFDEKGQFIRRYVPEIAHLNNKAIHAPWLAKDLFAISTLNQIKDKDYPAPIIDHATARLATLARYSVVKK
jgi:deoxyribodipyrimidine photo-lyase